MIHLIDSSQVLSHDPLRDFMMVNNELTLHNPDLLERPQVVAMNKMDLPESRANYRMCKEHFAQLRIKSFPISAVTGKGVKPLIDHVSMLLPPLHGG